MSFCHPYALRIATVLRFPVAIFCLAAVFCSERSALGQSNDGIAFFEQKIRPVLIEHCYACHSQKSEKLRANLLLDSKAGWQRGGDSGLPAIVPLHPEQSPLIASVKHVDLEMPPDKPKLPDGVIADLVSWVNMGAPDPRDGPSEAKRADKSWWSLQPLSESKPSETKPTTETKPALEVGSSLRNSEGIAPNANPSNDSFIDSFIDAKLSEQGLRMGPPADARTLIRRMSYDLIGLPPTSQEVAEFSDAYRKHPTAAVSHWIEKLLASPHYGEQWGRHWLDVVRFGESFGFERNVINDDIWPFRDYVIRSIQSDKPFNQLMVEHLAGDVVGKGDPDVEVGVAFLVAGPYDDVGNSDPVAAANIRAATLDDPITAISGAFLGLTIHCARCHNHKFDPIPTQDYYRIRAALEGLSHGRRTVASAEQQRAHGDALKPLNEEKSSLNKQRRELEKSIEERIKLVLETPTRPKIDVVHTEEKFPAIDTRFMKFVMRASTGNPKSAVGSRLTEFQVWSAEPEPRNVALASNGTIALGERSSVAEDFLDAYGPQLVIDGVLGEQWFVGSPAELRLNFAKTERVSMVSFANDKGNQQAQDNSRGTTPTDYDILVSMDGEKWQSVASSAGREPWSEAHAIERMRSKTITSEEQATFAKIDASLAQVEARIRKVTPLREVWVGKHEQPKVQTFVQKGGDPTKPLEPVTPAGLAVLDHILDPAPLHENADQGERRLALAKWITNDTNPLTARVLANRIWQSHFGTGIVDSPNDFGFQGSRPSHPELLDYLALRLIRGGWRIKDLHREIMLSRAYQQSSSAHDENFARGTQLDKSARLLWRFPPRRLTAEEIRDTILKTTDNLKNDMGGPGFRLYKFTQNNVCTYFPLDKHGPETYRRSVYHQNARASVVDILNDFDLPDNSFAAPKRANTTSPMQALTMLNHRFIHDMASSLSERVSQVSADPLAQIDLVFAKLLQRAPSDFEKTQARELMQSHGLKAFCRAMLNSNELLFVE